MASGFTTPLHWLSGSKWKLDEFRRISVRSPRDSRTSIVVGAQIGTRNVHAAEYP
jgi:hypothetical protein